MGRDRSSSSSSSISSFNLNGFESPPPTSFIDTEFTVVESTSSVSLALEEEEVLRNTFRWLGPDLVDEDVEHLVQNFIIEVRNLAYDFSALLRL